MRGLLLLLATLIAMGNSAPAFAQEVGELTVEYQLALVQRGRYVAPDDPLVGEFADVLDSLTSRCQETRLQLGNGAVNAVDTLRKQGVGSETLLSVLLGLDSAVPAELYGPDNPAECVKFLGMLEYLIVQGD